MPPDLRYWPELLREIAERVSPEAALKLAGKIGGQRISVPLKAGGSKLERDHGSAVASVIVDLHGGGVAAIPNFHAQLAHERKRFVLTNPQLSANECAKALGVTQRRVEQIRAEARPDPRQLDLLASG